MLPISRLLGTLCVLLLTLPSDGWGEDQPNPDQSGWYLGAGVGYSNVYSYTDTCYGCYGEADFGDGDAGILATIGYRISRHFAVEATYIDSGSMQWDDSTVFIDDLLELYAVDVSVDLTSYHLNALGILPFAQTWEAHLRGGFASWDATSDQNLTELAANILVTRSIDKSGTSFSFGVGVARWVADDWRLAFDYGYYAIDDDLLALGSSEKAYTDFLTVQLLRRFGGER